MNMYSRQDWQESIPKSLGTCSSHSTVRGSVMAGYVDDTAERNKMFYDAGPKVKVMYPKKLVYPPEGGEYCLEELRAVKYPCNDDDGMEMTEVIQKDITTNIPVIQVGGKAQLQPINPRGVKRAVGLERKPLSQLQAVDEELDELEQMLDNKAPVVLKTENSFGVSNFSYRSDHGDSLYCDASSFHKKLNFSDAESTGNISNLQNSMSHSNIQHSISHVKSYSLRESLSHSRHARKGYPNTPAVVKSSNSKLSNKPNLFEDVDDDYESQLSHSTAAHLLEQDLMNDSPDGSNWEVYQSECGSISQHSDHSVDTTTATAGTGRMVAEEESFDVYCDSVTAESLSHVSLSKHQNSLVASKENKPKTDEIKGWRENKRESIQLDPIPVAAENTSRFQLSLLDDQSTQFDIPRPASYDDHTSTPYPYQSVTNDVKNSPSKAATTTAGVVTAKTRSRPQQTPWNLSLISEESDVKSSSSDSACSSTSSKKVWLKEEGLLVHNKEQLPKEIDPYNATIVEYMCNNISNVRPIGVLDNSFNSLLITDSTIKLGGHSYLIKKLIGSGAFANIYLATDNRSGDKKALKVQSPACPWEYYITEELHCRLRHQGEGKERKVAKEKFMMIEDGYMSDRCSVLVTSYEALGTMLDLINTIKTNHHRRYSIDESTAAFYAVELINMVYELHQCQVIHGDIKPDNIMIMDIRKNGRCAIKLIDFGRSIDMRSFDSSTQFIGSCNTSGFVCAEMKSGKPWSWQVDYYAVAATIYCLMHGNYMEMIKMPGVGYKPRKNPPKYYNATMMWNKLFTQLLNTNHLQPPPLDQLANQLSKLVTTKVTSSINYLLDRMTIH